MEEKKGFFRRLVSGLAKTRDNIVSGMDSIFHGFSKIDEEFYEELEETLIMGDLGVHSTMEILEDLRAKVKERHIKEPIECRQLLIDSIREQMDVGETAYEFENRKSVVLVIGVNGVGKTTSVGKLAGKLKSKGKKPLLVACDVYRPAAIKQLQINGEKQGVEVFSMGDKNRPADIAKAALAHAQKNGNNIVILDTAGRLHIDEDMMAELQQIKEAVEVHQTILVVDAMTGQDAVNVAESFHNKIGIDGVIVTKLDGDTRGGAALSIKAVTGRPILYVGMGEKLSDLEQFYPDRMASRILGMGDVLTLIEKAGAELDEEKAMQMADKMKKAQFDFEDYLMSMEQMRKMGGLSSIMSMMPGLGGLGGKNKLPDLDSPENDKKMARMEAIIYSMTPEERKNPDLLNPSRKHRIAKGAGVDISEVNRMVKQFNESRKMMKKLPGMMGGKGGKKGRFRLPF